LCGVDDSSCCYAITWRPWCWSVQRLSVFFQKIPRFHDEIFYKFNVEFFTNSFATVASVPTPGMCLLFASVGQTLGWFSPALTIRTTVGCVHRVRLKSGYLRQPGQCGHAGYGRFLVGFSPRKSGWSRLARNVTTHQSVTCGIGFWFARKFGEFLSRRSPVSLLSFFGHFSLSAYARHGRLVGPNSWNWLGCVQRNTLGSAVAPLM